jgi:hypothetical protein
MAIHMSPKTKTVVEYFDKLLHTDHSFSMTPKEIQGLENILSDDQPDPYTFYILKSLQDAYAFVQRSLFHVQLMGFWPVIPQFTIAPTKGVCPACLTQMQRGKVQGLQGEDVPGLLCPACRTFVPIPQPQLITPCPFCREPLAHEPSGPRCVWCSPLSRTNQTAQPTQKPKTPPNVGN